MKEFNVMLTREITETVVITVRCKTKSQAKRVALDTARTDGTLDWENYATSFAGQPNVESIIELDGV